MKTIVFSAVLGAAAFAAAASAEEAVMTAPIMAASLHEGPLDMVAYYTPLEDEGLELTATFRARTDGAEPMRIVMRLEDGDDVSFAMPGYLASLYRFMRDDETVRMAVEHDPRRIASAQAPVLRVARAAQPDIAVD